MKIILASASPRRSALLRQIGLDFDVCPADVAEECAGLEPEALVLLNAERKAAAVCPGPGPAVVIGADTIVVHNGQILGKPKDRAEAFDMLRRLGGGEHTVYTGVCLLSGGKKRTFAERASVFMIDLTDADIEAYIDTGEPMDKAGAYGLQGRGAVFVREIRGDYTTVIGLPVCALWREICNIIVMNTDNGIGEI